MRLHRLLHVTIVAITVPLCAAALAFAAPVGAAPTLMWHSTRIDGTVALTGVSCASQSLCVAVDKEGHALISTNPTAGAGSTWSTKEIDGTTALTGVSCASQSLCVAVDKEGHALISTNPTAGAGSTWSTKEIDGTTALTGVSCASQSLCVAVDENGRALISPNPTAGASSTWEANGIDSGHTLVGVACAAGMPCVAIDNGGRVLIRSEPADLWSARQLDAVALTAVSCAAAPAAVCVASDAETDVLASGAPSATWSTTPLLPAGVSPKGVSCSAAGLCVAVGAGYSYSSDTPALAAPQWGQGETIDSSGSLTGVSCVAEGLCATVDDAGHVFLTTVAAPGVVAGTASALAETTATLSGTVNTNDALTSCRFEYGTSEAYGQSVPCPALAAGSTNQPVSAAVSGLAPNVTYDYRLVAVSARGEALSANATFTTTAPPLVQPHPSIGGLPARGQRLTCKSGVSGPGATTATLSYAWLRDTHQLGGATNSTYTVTSADVSHHLQCRVTATNAGGSATATSAFVTVPAGGLGAISETQVGSPRVAGRTVSVTVTCSAQAAGSCAITLRLTVVETLRHGRVVAVAARRGRGGVSARARATARRGSMHKTVTVGSVTAHLPAGHRGTVTVALNATGRALLKRMHKLTAKLSVSGTVVGALSAQLHTATVTFGAGAGKASSRHRR